MSKTRIAFLGILALLLIAPLTTQAISAKADEAVYVAKDQTIDSSLYTAGSTITVDGTIKGDLVCAGQSIIVNGTVEGDVLCAGQSININGKVGGSIRVAGNSVVLNGSVARTAMMAGASVIVSPQAVIGWDLVMGTASGQVGGTVKRDIYGASADLQITGDIGRHVALYMDDKRPDENYSALTITKDASIGGSLTYTGASAAKIEDGAVIKGETKHNLREMNRENRDRDGGPVVAWLWFKIISIFAALVVALVLATWLPKPVRDITDAMLAKIPASMGWGLIVLILTPIIVLILLVTIIGIPLSLMLLAFWILMMYPAKILAAIAIGRKLAALKFMPTNWHHSLIAATVIGVVISWFVFSVPIIGWILCFLAFIWGMGGIWRYIKLKSAR